MDYNDILSIFYETLNELLDVNSNNEKDVFESLRLSYHTRHNFLHAICSFILTGTLKYAIEKKASYYFPNLTKKSSEKTPDMILYFDRYMSHVQDLNKAITVILFDISVSSTSNLQSERKEEKYDDLCVEIQNLTQLPTAVYPISINSNLSNLETQLQSLMAEFEPAVSIDLPFSDIRLFFSALQNCQQKLKSMINNEELVEKYFKMEFGEDDIPFSSEFNENMYDRLETLFETYKNLPKLNQTTHEQLLMFDEELRSLKVKTNDEKAKKNDTDFQKYCKLLKAAIDDHDIFEKFKEAETTTDKVKESYYFIESEAKKFPTKKIKPSHQLFTPLLFTDTLTRPVAQTFVKDDELRLEQRQILDILSCFIHCDEQNPSILFLKGIYDSFKESFTGEHKDINLNIFNNNVYFTPDIDKKLKEQYHEYRQMCQRTKNPIKSFNSFLRSDLHEDVPADKDIRCYKQKMLKMPHDKHKDIAKQWWEKAHSGFRKEKKMRIKDDDSSLHLEHAKHGDKFLNLMTQPTTFTLGGEVERFFTATSEVDAHLFKQEKKNFVDELKPIWDEISYTVGFNYLYRQSQVAEQLMHFTQFSLPSNTYSFFTAGSSNLLYIVSNSYHNKGKDVGKAYMVCGYTDSKSWDNPFFGNVEFFPVTINGHEIFLFVTNWRRTETFKLTFLKDQFYSVLSTAMNALSRHKKHIVGFKRYRREHDYTHSIIKHHLSLKIMVALTTNQRIAEMLADFRYAIMASFSEFSEIDKLIIDKFSPKYGTVMEAWIASRVDHIWKQIHDFKDLGLKNAFFKQPVYINKKRKDDSIGGRFEIPSLWTGVIIEDLQDLLDDMFLYVHTLKEPSNIHHENIKAMKTIIEYQKKYDKLSSERKKGNYTGFDDFKEFLMDNNPIGHHSNITRLSSFRTMQGLRAFDLNLHSKKHFFEPVANITSTKAAIPEYEREIVPLSKLRTTTKGKKKLKKILEEREFIKEYTKFKTSQLREREKTAIKMNISKESFLPSTNRSKVHDCILDVLENNLDMSTVFDIAEWNVKTNSSRVVSDICIKAQYGGKREFYVINVGAKCNARILENIFSEICKVIPNEMISVPGDKKMLIMQDFLNDCLAAKKSNQRVFFVNGDCTKWSAAETMECFMSLIMGLAEFLDHRIVRYLLMVVCMWSNKKITIPQSILQNSFFVIDGLTDYLKKDEVTYDSTQNFLQGMFNYMSSFKAVCSSNFTKDVWQYLYPESKLKMEHLEHSDDYSLIITTEDIAELQKFRCLHRIIMKCHGFNDSIKKTNTQQFLMEFISLVSLNGYMTYPHIKKLKECGMNLGCTGYRDDIDAAMSRVGEAVRVGSILSSCYFMEKMHLFNLMKSYSTCPGQRNSITDNYFDMMKIPVELYGVPDMHPIILFLSKGMANNFRLKQYGKDKSVIVQLDGEFKSVNIYDLLINLTKTEIYMNNIEDVSRVNDFTEGLRLYHPHYSFDVENNLIKKIRNSVNMNFEEAINFWEQHVSYNFIKPRSRKLLITWMKAIYFKNNFALAYSRNSRAQITLRLSTFTTRDCCIMNPDFNDELYQKSIIDWVTKFITSTQNDTFNEFLKDMCNIIEVPDRSFDFDSILERTVLNCDSSISTIYSFIENSFMIDSGSHDRSTVAALTPVKLNWLNLNNPPDALLQYIFNYDDFLIDKRKNKGLASLEADKRIIENSYETELGPTTNITTVKSVYTDIILSQPKRNLCMTYSSQILNIEDFLRLHLEFSSIYQRRRTVITSGAIESINPHTGELFYKKFRTFTKNEFRVLIDDLVLIYALTKMMYKVDDHITKKILNNICIGSLKDFEHFGVREKLVSYDMLTTYNLNELKIMNFTNNELKSYAFLKAFVTGDLQPLLEIINQDFTYTYQYIHVPMEYKKIIKEIVEFDYQRCTFKAIRLDNPSDDILLFSELPKKSLLTDAMLIARKLFNKIRLNELERNFGTVPLRSMQEVEQSQENLEWFSVNRQILIKFLRDIEISSVCEIDSKGFNRFNYIEDDQTIVEILKRQTKQHFFVARKFTSQINGPNEFINRKLDINWETATIYVGKRKLFTLPILGAQQSNHAEVINDIKLNGISLNWWLKATRIEKLIKREKVPITKDDFLLFTDVEILDNKKLLGIEINNALHVLDKLPSKLFKTLPEDMQVIIENRLFHPDYSIIGKTDKTVLQRKLNNIKNTEKIAKSHRTETIDETNINITMDKDMASEMDDLLADFDFKPAVEQSYEDMMKELDEINLDNVVFKQLDEDEMQEVEDEVIRQLEHESGSSNSNNINKDLFLDFDEFQNIEAQNIVENVFFSSTQNRTQTILESIGNPSTYVVNKNYIDSHTLDLVSTKEKLGLLYRLNDILQCVVGLTDLELLLTVTLVIEILKSISKNEEWLIKDDFVLTYDSDQNKLNLFLRYEGFLDETQKAGLKKKGGKIKRQKIVDIGDGIKIRQSVKSYVTNTLKEGEFEEYALIPLNEDRTMELLNQCITGFTIESFLNITILKDCYYRLFKEPFVRTGFALELLNELLF
uniref:RNA-directed RNA polymerase L n=1 Tax=Rhizopus microsporus phasma-like virus 1 TaxID=3156537 RepID=A0AAT9H819_9VIRU